MNTEDLAIYHGAQLVRQSLRNDLAIGHDQKEQRAEGRRLAPPAGAFSLSSTGLFTRRERRHTSGGFFAQS